MFIVSGSQRIESQTKWQLMKWNLSVIEKLDLNCLVWLDGFKMGWWAFKLVQTAFKQSGGCKSVCNKHNYLTSTHRSRTETSQYFKDFFQKPGYGWMNVPAEKSTSKRLFHWLTKYMHAHKECAATLQNCVFII